MNVIYFASSKGLGLTSHLTEYAIGLKKMGVNIIVIYDYYPYKKELVNKLNEHDIINVHFKQLDELNLLYQIKNIIEIVKLINKYDIEIIQCQGLLNLVLAFISKLISKKKPKITLYYHSFPAKYQTTPPKSRIFLPVLMRIINMLSDAILPVSKQTYNYLLDFGVDPQKTFVIYNSLNFDELHDFSDVNKYHHEMNKFYKELCNRKFIVYAAQLISRKGHKVLLTAFKDVLKIYSDVILVCIGGGILKDYLIDLSTKLGIDENVFFTGKLEYELTINIISKATIAVIPSYEETFCHALIEPMAFGIPVISTKVGIAEEIIINDKTGYLVHQKNPKELSEKIIFLLENSDHAKKIGQNGRKKVEEEFNISKISEKLVETYQIISKKR